MWSEDLTSDMVWNTVLNQRSIKLVKFYPRGVYKIEFNGLAGMLLKMPDVAKS